MIKTFDNESFFKTISESLKQGQSVSFMVKGNSMKPFFIDGSTEVFLNKKDDYHKGDVCLFKYKDNYILHRLIKIKEYQYIFRGDHLYHYEQISEGNILGFVYRFKRNHKVIDSSSLLYKIKVNIYLLYKSLKMVLRKLIRGN
jgi:signal peptidase I